MSARFFFITPLILLAATGNAQTTSKPNAIDLNGTWRDQQGQQVKITQTGSQITLKTAGGREFSGKLDGPLLELQHSLTPEETEPNLPPQVRELCAGQEVTIRSVVSPDGNEIKGTYTGKRPRWEKKDNQYTILGWDDVPDESLFNRNGYYISELSIDYYGWEHTHNELQAAVTDAYDTVNIKQASLDAAKKALDTERTSMQQLSSVLDQKRSALQAADANAANSDPPDSAKSTEYKNTEASISRIQTRQTTLEGYFDQIHKGTSSGDPQAISKLFEEYDQNKATLATLQATLQKLQDQSGFTAKLAAAAKAAQQADDDYFAALKNDAHERNLFENADHAAVRAQQAVDDATNTYYIALGARNKYDAQKSPQIVGVKAGSYYDVSYWTPADTLRDIDKSIVAVQARVTQLDAQRTEDMATMDSAGQRALAAGQVLAGKQGALGGSAIFQALIESGFYAWDVGRAWQKGGPAAALFEAAKKGVEGLVLGPPKFADPDISQQDMDTIFEQARDAMVVTVGKRAAKTAFGYPVAVGATAFIKAENEAALADTADELADVLRSGGTIEAALAKRYSDQITLRDQAVSNYQKAVKDGTFRKLGANLATKFVIGVVKDVAKQAMKQQVANYFVGDAFLDNLEADMECRGAAILLLKDNARYYDAHDTLAYLVQLRQSIESQYDPKSHMKVNRNQTFYAQAGLPLSVKDASSGSANHTATVILGGQKATPSGTMQYTVNAYELVKTADGGVKLEIKVEN
jgi:hypothetical protein